jgi:D-alanyl-D-alanine dipeptidase
MTSTLIALVTMAATMFAQVPTVDVGAAGPEPLTAQSGDEGSDGYVDRLLRARKAQLASGELETFGFDVLVRVPVVQEAYSWDLIDKGLKNGQLPSSVLMSVGSCVLERDAAYTMSQMVEAAAADGVKLRPAWCYRNLPQQRSTYEVNCPLVEPTEPLIDPRTGRAVLDESGEPVLNVTGPPERSCTLPTATPSRSNHGWGRAVDFEVRNRTMGCGDAAFRWLQENAGDFGWIHPEWAQCNRPTREPWHWEYGGLQLLPFPSLLPPEPILPPAKIE